MIWQEVRNDRFRGMGVHCYRYKRTAAVGRLEPFVLNRLGYSQFARRGCTYRTSLERCRGGARFASRRCRDWRASPWWPRCRRPSVSVDGLPCDQRAARRRGPLGCGSGIRLRSNSANSPKKVLASTSWPSVERSGAFSFAIDRVETPAGIAGRGRLTGESTSREVSQGRGCDAGRAAA